MHLRPAGADAALTMGGRPRTATQTTLMPAPDTGQNESPGPTRSLEPAGNIAFTYASTGLDLLYLATTVLVFPRIADKAMFAEYRILILYGGYAGFLHLGILNGFYQESLHSASQSHKLALFRKARRLLFWVLLLVAPIGALVFSLLNPTASKTTVAAILISWFLLNGQTLNNYATQTQGRFDRFFAYNCIGRSVGILFVFAIAFSRDLSTVTLDASFLLPTAVTVAVAEAFNLGRLSIYAAAAPAAPQAPVTLHWRSCLHLYAANVFAALALSADKIVVASQFARKIFADYSFAFSLSSLVLYAGDGIATATLPLLLRKGATDNTRRQSHSIWKWLYWSAPFAFWPAIVFVDRWYAAYATCIPFLACFSATLPAVIYCKSYCGSAAIAARVSHLQSRINLLGLLAVALGIVAASFYGKAPLLVCEGWCVGIFAWAASCSWQLGRNSDERVRGDLLEGFWHVAMSAAAFGVGYGSMRLGHLVAFTMHGAVAALILFLWRVRQHRGAATCKADRRRRFLMQREP
jgi:hypothetical protein